MVKYFITPPKEESTPEVSQVAKQSPEFDDIEPYVGPKFDVIEAEKHPLQELANREIAKRSLLPFIQRYRPKYEAGWVHEDICRRLERFVQDVAAKKMPRMLLMMPPRSGKSEIGSRHFPAWVMGHYPDWEIIAASHTSSLSLGFSRYIRDLLVDPSYRDVFPDTTLNPTSRAIERWHTTEGGGYLAAGVGTGITGRGAHILLLDDLVKDIEAADSATIRENTWTWYTSTAYTRLAPGGGVLGIMCMTGDTPVFMADGTEQRLDALTPGALIATYENGYLSTSTVAAVKSSGRDSVLKITTSSGKIVRANQRHPFLTIAPTGELVWTRTHALTTAHRIVVLRDSGGSGKESPALSTAARNQPSAEVCAAPTTTSRNGQTDGAPSATVMTHDATLASSTATASLPQNTTPCTKLSEAAALFAASTPAREVRQITGKTSSPSTTATTQVRSEDCSATLATPESDTLELSPSHVPLRGIYDFTLDEIVSIEPDGDEEVYDVQVDRTENFIANGLVSHNTHWHDDDWAGRIQQVMKDGDGDKFEIVKYPAINESGDEYMLADETIVEILPRSVVPEGARLTRPQGEALHPARYDTQAMLRIKNNLVASGQKRIWSALYQQNPAPDEGAFFTKDMFRFYSAAPARRGRTIVQAWDFAITTGEQNDYTVGVTLMQDEFDSMYVLDVRRFRSGDGMFIVDEILNYSMEWDADVLGFEDGQIWKSIASTFDRRCIELKHYPTYEILVPLTDKMVRAGPLKGRMQIGKLYFDKKKPWYNDLEHEMLRFPAGKHDDQCFVAGTRITLADGTAVPIQDIAVGQYVLTPDGPRAVLAASETAVAAQVHRVELSNGRVLIGTGNHPVSTERGWVELSSLAFSDIIHARASQHIGESSWQGFTRKLLRMWTGLSSTGSSTGATLTRLTRTFAATTAGLVAEGFSIATSGSFTMAQYRMAMSSTTGMRTTLTTTSKTWSASARGNTTHTFTASNSNTVAQKNRRSTWHGFASSLKRGMQALKGGRGMQSTQRILGVVVHRLASFAASVRQSFSRFSVTPSSAARLAKSRTGESATLTMTRRSVLARKHAVYNLTVDDVHCYYANGVLVHNCDALAWAVRTVLTRTAPRVADQTPEKVDSWMKRLKLGGGSGSIGHMSA